MWVSEAVRAKEHSSFKEGSLHTGARVLQFSKTKHSKVFGAFQLMLKALQSLNVPEGTSWYVGMEVYVHEGLWDSAYNRFLHVLIKNANMHNFFPVLLSPERQVCGAG